jgi:hypothetical protein
MLTSSANCSDILRVLWRVGTAYTNCAEGIALPRTSRISDLHVLQEEVTRRRSDCSICCGTLPAFKGLRSAGVIIPWTWTLVQVARLPFACHRGVLHSVAFKPTGSRPVFAKHMALATIEAVLRALVGRARRLNVLPRFFTLKRHLHVSSISIRNLKALLARSQCGSQ